LASLPLKPETPEKSVATTTAPKPLVDANWEMVWDFKETTEWFASDEAQNYLTDIMSGAVK
jgi:hypothetical protein